MISLRVYLDSGKPSFRADYVFAESIKTLILRPCVKKVSFTVDKDDLQDSRHENMPKNGGKICLCTFKSCR